MVDHVKPLSLQFAFQGPDGEKLRRLVDGINRTQSTLNSLIDQVNAIVTGSGSGTTLHELASESGLGVDHEVAGLIEGHVLKAFSDVDAHFGVLQLQELARTDWTGGENNGDILYFTGGYWKPTPAMDVLGLGDPGADTVLGWSVDLASQIYRTAGPGIGLDDGSIFVRPDEIQHGDLAGLSNDDHPQYTEWSQDEVISGSWTFQMPTTFLNPVYQITDTVEQEADSPENIIIADDAAADEHRWSTIALPGMLQYRSLYDDGTAGEAWLTVSRIGEIIDAVDVEGNRFAFNGASVTTEVELALNVRDSNAMSYFMGGS